LLASGGGWIARHRAPAGRPAGCRRVFCPVTIVNAPAGLQLGAVSKRHDFSIYSNKHTPLLCLALAYSSSASNHAYKTNPMTIERLLKMEGGKYRHLADSNHLEHLRNGEANTIKKKGSEYSYSG